MTQRPSYLLEKGAGVTFAGMSDREGCNRKIEGQVTCHTVILPYSAVAVTSLGGSSKSHKGKFGLSGQQIGVSGFPRSSLRTPQPPVPAGEKEDFSVYLQTDTHLKAKAASQKERVAYASSPTDSRRLGPSHLTQEFKTNLDNKTRLPQKLRESKMTL